jgi:hypothetical protein
MEAKNLTSELWQAKFDAVKLKTNGKTPEYGEITRMANMDPVVSKSTFNHRFHNKGSRPTMFCPVPALGVLERDLMEWMRNYKTMGVMVLPICFVNKALRVAKMAGIAWDFKASRSSRRARASMLRTRTLPGW